MRAGPRRSRGMSAREPKASGVAWVGLCQAGSARSTPLNLCTIFLQALPNRPAGLGESWPVDHNNSDEVDFRKASEVRLVSLEKTTGIPCGFGNVPAAFLVEGLRRS